MAICRQCHRKMGMINAPIYPVYMLTTPVFKIPEVKFLIVGTAAGKSDRSLCPLMALTVFV